ncbi:ribonuclease Z [Candidatus Bathyarchaeota archaeon]|nr:ribonuclease Z [Candidatus Bathyarchaeota archaeon]
MRVIILGTAASISSRKNRLPAIAVQNDSGEILIFDTGEDIQRSYSEANLKFNKPTSIFITHLHGDHVIGLPGLLFRMDLLGRTRAIDIFGPPGIHLYIDTQGSTIGLLPRFKMYIHEINLKQNVIYHYPPKFKDMAILGESVEPIKDSIKNGVILKKKGYEIIALEADHTSEHPFSFVYMEADKLGKFNPERALERGIPRGHLWGKLHEGQPVRLPDGGLIDPEKDGIVGKPRRGRTILVSGDTRPTEGIITFVKTHQVDLLIHEATFLDELRDVAKEKKHTTAKEAAEIAACGNVSKLIITHFSSRYTSSDSQALLEQEAKQSFPNTIIAKDMLEIQL